MGTLLTREQFIQAAEGASVSMYRAARAVLDSDADAEDAVGQALLLAWQARKQAREPSSARTWLVAITVNCVRRLRRERNRVMSCVDLEPILGGQEDRHYHELWEAVLALPPGECEVVTLFYYEDLTIQQTARALAIPAGTVKSRLNRARGRLREWLKEDET